MKYHISDKTGEPAICKASKEPCRMGIHQEHFESLELAQKFLEKEYEKEYSFLNPESKELNTPDSIGFFENLLKNDFYKEKGMSSAALATFKESAGEFGSLTDIAGFDDEWSESKGSDVSTFVERVETEDGAIGYYKSVILNCEEETGVSEFGGSTLKSIINEVRASNFAESLGFKDLVPTTYFVKNGNDDFGTFQEEVDDHIDVDFNRRMLNRVNIETLKKARLFDFIVGSGDRHDDNYLISKNSDNYDLALIDNGYSFPTDEVFHCTDSDMVGYDYNDHLPITYDSGDFESLRDFKNSDNFGGLENQFTDQEKKGVLQRINYVLKHETVPTFEEYFNSLN